MSEDEMLSEPLSDWPVRVAGYDTIKRTVWFEPDPDRPPLDADAFDAAESVIERGRAWFFEVGRAISSIRERGRRELRARGYDSFEDYIERRWGWSRQHGYRLIRAAGVVENLGRELSPRGDSLPTEERQARVLVPLPAADQRAVWHDAVRTSPDGKPRVADLRRIVRDLEAERKAARAAAPAPDRPAAAPPAKVRLEAGDATALPLDDASVGLIVTSPPYALDVDYRDAESADSQQAWMRTIPAALAECFRIAKPGGRLALNVPLDTTRHVGPSFTGSRATYALATAFAIAAGWTHRFSIVWDEGNVTHSVGRGSVDSAAAPHVIAPVEMVAVFAKTHWRTFLPCRHPNRAEHPGEDLQWVPEEDYSGDLSSPDLRREHDEVLFCMQECFAPWRRGGEHPSDLAHDDWLQWTNGLWRFNGESRAWEGHPAAFPEELPRRLIKLLSFPGDTVLDPFMGSGTTPLVAHRLGRVAIGFDISPAYVDSARRRFAAEFGGA